MYRLLLIFLSATGLLLRRLLHQLIHGVFHFSVYAGLYGEAHAPGIVRFIRLHYKLADKIIRWIYKEPSGSCFAYGQPIAVAWYRDTYRFPAFGV